MDKNQIIKKVACWIGYCLFAGWSAVMTAESCSMSMDLKPVWLVFIFVFIVALIAGFCLSGMIRELQNRTNPSKGLFVLYLLGFLLFWSFSFMTNVHYSFMRNDGLKVVKAELGNYRDYIEREGELSKQAIEDDKRTDLGLLDATLENKFDVFLRECDHSIRDGFGPQAREYLKDIEAYFISTSNKFNDMYNYQNSIFDDEKDKGDLGTKGNAKVAVLKDKYRLRIVENHLRRQGVIEKYYKALLAKRPSYANVKIFIKDSLMSVDIPQLEDIATPQVYYQFQKVQLSTIRQHLSASDLARIDLSMKDSKTKNIEDIDKGKFRYRIYPSERMFNTFNVWGDVMGGRMPSGMKLLGWILFSLIIDIVAFVLRIFAR